MAETTSSKTSSLGRVAIYHPTGNLGAFFTPALAQHRTKVAIIDLSSSTARVLTYDGLEAAVRSAVGALSDIGFKRGDRAAVALPNSADFLITLLALMRVGAIPIVPNSKLGAHALRFILQDSGCSALFADLAETPLFSMLAADLGLPHRLSNNGTAAGWRDWPALRASAALSAHVEPMATADQAFQPYTAGSTGVPKGIVMTHGGMLWGIEHMQSHWPARPEMRGIVAAPLFHKNAMRGTVKPLLRAGASFVVMPRFRPRDYLQAIEKYRVTRCSGVPAMFAELLRERDLVSRGDFSALTYITMGSSTVPVELLARIAEVFPNAKVAESYGLTEGGGPIGPPLDGRRVPRGSVGVVAPEAEVRLVNANGNNADEGELWIRSPYVMAGYANNPKLTAERLRDGWLRTGDVLRKDADGFFYFVGRTDDMFVCGGENIYPKEVEELILRHPGVSDVIVQPLPHDTKGFAPVALIQSQAGYALTPQDVQDFCAANGPAFAIPRAVLIVAAMPLSDAGKPDRLAASKQLSAAFGTLKSRSDGGRS